VYRHPITVQLQIQNESKLPAKYSFVPQEAGSKGLASLTVMPPSGSLAARANRDVTVTLTPACLGRIELPLRLKVHPSLVPVQPSPCSAPFMVRRSLGVIRRCKACAFLTAYGMWFGMCICWLGMAADSRCFQPSEVSPPPLPFSVPFSHPPFFPISLPSYLPIPTPSSAFPTFSPQSLRALPILSGPSRPHTFPFPTLSRRSLLAHLPLLASSIWWSTMIGSHMRCILVLDIAQIRMVCE
jgi:hypothetical protein